MQASWMVLIVHITKCFFISLQVIVLFQLLEKGHVKSLDEPISNYCLSFSIKNPYNIDSVVTLRLVKLHI